MALTHTETPLKGGVNTPLVNPDFSGVLPQSQSAVTPNLVLATPFKSNRDGAGGATPSSAGFLTPAGVGGALVPMGGVQGNFTPISVRDKLNINTDENMSVLDTPLAVKQYQRQMKSSLREGLAGLPTPKNDYEIVVPEQQEEMEGQRDGGDLDGGSSIEDQSDVDARRVEEVRRQRAAELRRRSQVIQRSVELPRPFDINTTILRPVAEMQGLNELQRAEEMIKAEMITMLHFDALKDPIQVPLAPANTKKFPTAAQHASYLQEHAYQEFDEEEMRAAQQLLEEEMATVKRGMMHGDLSLESYTQVWEECLEQVLYLPSQNRYTRANLASKKDRLESAEFKLEQNRKFMAKEAKRCGKIEKRLKILTGGYQAKAQALIKQLQETFEQIEQSHLALSTFRFLAQQEENAIPRRMEVRGRVLERDKYFN